MKNTLLTLLLLALFGTGLHAQTQCQASYSATPAGVGWPAQTMYFASTSTFPNTAIPSYSWDFGDGGVGGGSVYHYTYSAPGIYNVCLTFTDLGTGCTSQICQAVQVGNPGPGPSCSAYFMGSLATNGITNMFNYTGVLHNNNWLPLSNVSYTWDFGDGSQPVVGSSQITHIFPLTSTTGSYQVCVTATDTVLGCTATYCEYQSVAPAFPCDATFSSFEFSAGTITWNAWYAGYGTDSIDFGDGTVIANTGTHQLHTYTANGTYNICRWIYSQTLGCMDTFCQQIAITGVNNGCVVSFHPSHTTNNPLTVDLFGSYYSYISGSQTAQSWVWDFGDGTIDSTSGGVASHTYAVPGQYNVCVTTTDSSGCVANYCAHVITAGYLPPPPYCDAGYFHYEAGLGYVYFFANMAGHSSETWDFGDGTILTGSNPNPMHGYAANGTYTVCRIVSDSLLGCTDTFCNQVAVISVGQSTNACYTSFTATPNPVYSQQLLFNGQHYNWIFPAGVASWDWDFGDGSTAATTANTTSHIYAQAGTYNVCVVGTDSIGCTSTYCEFITVAPSSVSLGAVSGVVSGGGTPLDSGTVYLITVDPATQVLSLLDSVVLAPANNGAYSFSNLLPGFYTVKASPAASAVFASGYVPTYHGNVVNWQSAAFFIVGGAQPAVANVALIGALVPSSVGSGSISGTIQAGANKTGGMGGVHLLLMNAQKTVVGHTHSDENGDFVFNALPEGTYMVYLDMMNRTMMLKPLSLMPGSMSVAAVNVTIHSTEITVDATTSTNAPVVPVAAVSLYPNPAQDEAFLSLDLPEAAETTITLRNGLGQAVGTQTRLLGAGSTLTPLEIKALPAGVYLVQVQVNGTQLAALRLVKE